MSHPFPFFTPYYTLCLCMSLKSLYKNAILVEKNYVALSPNKVIPQLVSPPPQCYTLLHIRYNPWVRRLVFETSIIDVMEIFDVHT